MKRKLHARFWIGGEESDLLADHTCAPPTHPLFSSRKEPFHDHQHAP